MLTCLPLLVLPATASAKDLVYEGTWVTTNRKLDGPITCAVTDLGDNQWRGHFYGVWQGVQFSYLVDFSGPPEKLRGRAVIDGTDYEWVGTIGTASAGSFRGQFWRSRYIGSFTLKQKGKQSVRDQ
jgi:hypothetical protein